MNDDANELYIASGKEVGNAWNVLDDWDEHPAGWYGEAPGFGLFPGPAWFDQNGIDMCANIALEVEKRLKDQHWRTEAPRTHHSQRRKAWVPKKYHLIAQGIAVGIKIGLFIAEQRNKAGTDIVVHTREES